MTITSNNYNADSPLNVMSTVLLVAAIMLNKEGYKNEDIEEMLLKVALLSTEIMTGKAKITGNGIEKVTEDNVVPMKLDA